MEPRVRFARAEDGVAIAFWSLGEGVPLVHAPLMPWSHLQLEWQNPEMQRWYEALTLEARLIRYDGRGTGLSERNPADIGIDAQVRDIQAVVDSLALQRFILLGTFNSAPATMVYAARNPDRVAGLILWCAYANGEEYNRSPRVAYIRDLIDDWELYTETGAHAFVGWGSGDNAHSLAAMMRECVTQEMAVQFLEEMRQVDCTPYLPMIKAPALVLHPRRFPLIDIALARNIAALIPDARLVALEGDSLAPSRSNVGAALAAIHEFVALAAGARESSDPAPAQAPMPLRPGLSRLTPREMEILRLVALGKNNREIAEDLVLSPRTVERHIANVYTKVQVSNRAQATALAMSLGLVA